MNIKRRFSKADLKKAQYEMLESLIKVYPFFNTERQNIIDKCIEQTKPCKPVIKKISKGKDIVLEMFVHKEQVYFKDKFGGVLNDKAELIGCYKNDHCELFENNIIIETPKHIYAKILETNNNEAK
jgi:hypothetical protein